MAKERVATRCTYRACWSIDNGYLVLHSLSEGTAERFRKRFFRTFGLTLVLVTLDFLEKSEDVETIMEELTGELKGVLMWWSEGLPVLPH